MRKGANGRHLWENHLRHNIVLVGAEKVDYLRYVQNTIVKIFENFDIRYVLTTVKYSAKMPKTQNNFPTVIWVDGTMKHENFHRLGKTTPMQFGFNSITIYHAKSELFTLFPSLIRNDPSIKIFFL